MRLVRSGAIALSVLLTFGFAARAQPAAAPEAARGFLGVLLVPSEDGKAGIVVREVTPDTPAAKAGLKPGDRIVKLDKDDVSDVRAFLRTIASKKPGDKLTLGIVRDGKDQNLAVTVGERPTRTIPPNPDRRRSAVLGVEARPMSPELKDRLKVDTDAGVVVTEVIPDSPAAKAGFKRDDVITAVDGKLVKTSTDLRDAVLKAGAGKEIALQVLRGKEKLTLKAKLQEGRPGFVVLPGDDRSPPLNLDPIQQARRIRELERRVEELEKQVRDLEKKK
jgi:serine protease Do